MESEHPGYGFAEHKGYGTPAHTAALAELGPCSQHRYSFINVRRLGVGVDADADRVSGTHADGVYWDGAGGEAGQHGEFG